MVTLQINGQEMTFSEQQLTAIVEKHFNNVQINGRCYEVVKKPTEGKLFRVDPKSLDRKLFTKNVANKQQEETRQLILKALREVDAHPEKYSRVFYTMLPVKSWQTHSVLELLNLPSALGGQIGDWVEQSLEWAQRIHNGETWETICNEPDRANWFRLVMWWHGYIRRVGGSKSCNIYYPVSRVCDADCCRSSRFDDTVPFVVYH